MAADAFDPAELLPAGEEQSADDALEAALSGLVPDTQPDTVRPYGRGWAFDFQTGQFVAHGTSPARIDGIAQLRTWIEKTLRTARFAHAVYSDEYGVDNPWEGIGFPFTPGTAAKIQSNVEDALTNHDRISRVEEFRFDGGGSSSVLVVSFRVVADEDDSFDISIPFGRV